MKKNIKDIWFIFKKVIVFVVLFLGLMTPSSFFVASLRSGFDALGFDELGIIFQQGSLLVYGIHVASAFLPLIIAFFMNTPFWFYVFPICFVVFKSFYGFNQEISLPWSIISFTVLTMLLLIKKKTNLLNWYFEDSLTILSFKRGVFTFSLATVVSVFLAYPLSFIGGGGGWIDAQPIAFVLYIALLPAFLSTLLLTLSKNGNQKYFACLLYVPVLFFLLINDYGYIALILLFLGMCGLGLGLLLRRLYDHCRVRST